VAKLELEPPRRVHRALDRERDALGVRASNSTVRSQARLPTRRSSSGRARCSSRAATAAT
jgi:hypothetical protein